MRGDVNRIRDDLKKAERRIDTLNNHLGHSENFKKLRRLADKRDALYAEYKTLSQQGLLSKGKAKKALEVASAFGNAACRQGLKVQSLRVNRLLGDLLAARNNGTWAMLLAALKKPELLILDDFGLSPLDPLHCRDLLEIVDDRYGHGSILVTAQLPVSGWHGVFADPTIADAVLDRLVHNAHRIALHGPSRRYNAPQNGNTNDKGAVANPYGGWAVWPVPWQSS